MLFLYGTKFLALFRKILPIFCLLLTFCLLTACSDTKPSGAKENIVSLDKIAWCNNQKVLLFMDDAALTAPATSLDRTNTDTLGPATGTPVALKDWNTLKAHLGFSVFLPTGLPAGSCLLGASGSVRNAVLGSNFTLTYLLPDQTSLTITQTLQRNKKALFHCSAMPDSPSSSSSNVSSEQEERKGTPTIGVQICTGNHGTTTITFSVNWNQQKLWRFFQDLKPNENWIPHT
jgi:hypothetical protein